MLNQIATPVAKCNTYNRKVRHTNAAKPRFFRSKTETWEIDSLVGECFSALLSAIQNQNTAKTRFLSLAKEIIRWDCDKSHYSFNNPAPESWRPVYC
ncbi:hypothetical protein GCM10023156_42500 [Novipirellula rosea]|uniref:Uncharacterized protein n=1 Tax=Novipirellula rosea TaxID=1031540 RepID=A0ABP8N3X6_9BACT